ncbi:MAG TPA: hypothetical protein VHD84_01865 [Candidatus Saccharimonadales bacterium]|nr:hypothetical protein [Candidatus Saccharimonadales bacterium]
MSMHWLEGELRKGEKPGDLTRAKIIAALLEDRGEDIQFSEQVAPAAGHLALKESDVYVLRDEATELITKDSRQEVEGVEKATEISRRIETLLEPYNHIFDAHIPTAGSNQRTIWRKIKVGEIRNTYWQYRDTTDHLYTTYDYTLGAVQGETRNTIDYVVLRLLSQHDETRWYDDSEARLTITFAGNQIDGVTLGWAQATPHTLLELAKGTHLAKFIEDFMVLGNNDQDSSTINFSMRDQDPKLIIRQRFGSYMGAKIRYGEASSTFRFIPKKDGFKRYIGDVAKHNSVHEVAGISLRDELSNEEYLLLLQETLALIPTISEEQLTAAT